MLSLGISLLDLMAGYGVASGGPTAVVFVASRGDFEASAESVRALVLVGVLVPLAVADLTRGLLPNAITVPAGVLGLALSTIADPEGWWMYPVSALTVGGGLFVLAVSYPGGMGMGDVKMGAMLGAFLGPYAALAVFTGAFCGALVGGGLIASGRLARSAGLPFGVFMAFGALLALFFGPGIWSLYAGTM